MLMHNRCNICLAVFNGWPEYNTHYRAVHASVAKVVPTRTTTRTKGQIVADFERRIGVAIIGLLLLGLWTWPVHADDDGEGVGSQEPQGIQGIPGNPGPQGPQGVQGYQGSQGNPGIIGPQGRPGFNGTNGANGATGAQGVQGITGKQGDKGTTGAKGDKGNPGDDMNNRLTLNIGAQVRWYDWKHIALTSGYRYDVRHYGHTVDMFVVQFKLGNSYEQRAFEAQAKELKAIEETLRRMAQGPSVDRVSELFETTGK
jgi:hypothetical protein